MKRRPQRAPAKRPADGSGLPYAALLCLLVTLFLATALLTFSSLDWPNPHVYPHPDPATNACGKVGAWLSYHILRTVGGGGYALVFFAGLGALLWLSRGPVDHVMQRAAGVVVLAVVISITAALFWPAGMAHLPAGYAGALGQYVADIMRENFSWFGTVLILSYCALAALVFIIEGFWTRLARFLMGCIAALRRPWAPFKRAVSAVVSGATSRAGQTVRDEQPRADARRQTVEPQLLRADRATTPAATAEEAAPGAPGRPADLERRSKVRKEDKEQLTFRTNQPLDDGSIEPYPAVLDDWVLPPISLLDDLVYKSAVEQERSARDKAKILEGTLRDYRIEAPVVAIETGPVITLYELRLAPGVKVSQITALSNDIARALKAPAIRVVAAMAGKSTVGIEVPRIERERVRLKELMTMTGKAAQPMALPLFLGKDASGNPMLYDLARMPHLLIAGTTGSGKSVCINSIIMSLLMTQRPDRVNFILIDPKMVELSAFKDVPHLMCPIVTDMTKAEQILEWACGKMEERYALFAEAGARNILDYNRLGKEEILQRFSPGTEQEAALIPLRVPYLVIVIDELADLMMTKGKEVEHHLARLAQKSRAVGIHIVVATQRPEAKVVTGLIKSNMPCRCAFRVAARMDSRIVLDQNGAEVLLGQGDMLFLPPGSAHLQRAQGTYIEDSELRGAIADLRQKGKCVFHPELMKLTSKPSGALAERDELFDQAVRIILESQRGSVSLLQRRLTIGYSRASRLVDQMAEAGIVGQYKGSQAREVLMTLDDWDDLQAQQEVAEDEISAQETEEAWQSRD